MLITFAISLLLAAACVVLKQHLPAEQPIDQDRGCAIVKLTQRPFGIAPTAACQFRKAQQFLVSDR